MDAALRAERGRDGVAERDADVLHRVMGVHVEVALGGDREIEAPVPGDQLEHVVEESDARPHVVAAPAIEVERETDVCLGGLPIDGCVAPHDSDRFRFRVPGFRSSGFWELAALCVPGSRVQCSPNSNLGTSEPRNRHVPGSTRHVPAVLPLRPARSPTARSPPALVWSASGPYTRARSRRRSARPGSGGASRRQDVVRPAVIARRLCAPFANEDRAGRVKPRHIGGPIAHEVFGSETVDQIDGFRAGARHDDRAVRLQEAEAGPRSGMRRSTASATCFASDRRVVTKMARAAGSCSACAIRSAAIQSAVPDRRTRRFRSGPPENRSGNRRRRLLAAATHALPGPTILSLAESNPFRTRARQSPARRQSAAPGGVRLDGRTEHGRRRPRTSHHDVSNPGDACGHGGHQQR